MCKSIILRCLWWIENYLVIYQQTFLYLYPLHLKGQSWAPPTHTSHTSIDDLHLGHIYCTPFMADQTSCSPGAPQDSARLQSAIPWISTSLMSVSCSSFSVSCSSHICPLFLFHQSAVPLTVHTSVSCSSYISQLFLLYQSAVPLI